MALTIGTQLGSHEITGLLGKGGMGEVYRARDLKLKREVAIKILPDEFSRDADRVSRFQREAEVLASLNHPNIAAIYDLAEAIGTRFLVLELVEGETLADRIARGPISADETLDIAKQIAEALEAAHERGIIHRDLKPANVKLTPDGKVKVLDFGLAKAMEGAPTNEMASNSPTLLSGTMGGMLIGTAAYMSPEQAAGKSVDKRADIWSFGVVLWEMLAGEQLFKGETVSHILASVLKDEPDLSRVPLKSRRLLQRCLEKDTRKRLRDIGEARFLLDDSSVAAAPVLAPRRTWLAWTAGALAVVAAVFALLWLQPRSIAAGGTFRDSRACRQHAPTGNAGAITGRSYARIHCE
jgi:serine/threonine-protein kinase